MKAQDTAALDEGMSVPLVGVTCQRRGIVFFRPIKPAGVIEPSELKRPDARQETRSFSS